MVEHVASVHLKLPIFKCRICSKSYSLEGSVKIHINREHHQTFSGNYDDLTGRYENEIIAGIDECFGVGVSTKSETNQKKLGSIAMDHD